MAHHPRLCLGRQTIFPNPPDSLESNSNSCNLVISHHLYTVSILNVYEAALTYMISVNTNDVQHSKITFDHICVASRIMSKVLLMAEACTYFINKSTTIA